MVEPAKEREETTSTKEKTEMQKWLDRFVTFLAMGGFIVVIGLIVGIVIGILMLTEGC